MNMFARLVLALKGLLGQKAPSAAVTATPVYKFIGANSYHDFPYGLLLLAAKNRRMEQEIWMLKHKLEASQASVRVNGDIARDAHRDINDLAKALKKSGKRNGKLSVKNHELLISLAETEAQVKRLQRWAK